MSFFTDWLSLREAPVPSTAVELASNYVCAAALDLGGTLVVAHEREDVVSGVDDRGNKVAADEAIRAGDEDGARVARAHANTCR